MSWRRDARKVLALLKSAEYDRLNEIYELLLMHCLFAGVLVVTSLRLTATWPFKAVLTFPFMVVFAIYLFLLPMDYAVLMKRLTFPSVADPVTVRSALTSRVSLPVPVPTPPSSRCQARMPPFFLSIPPVMMNLS